MATKTIRTDYGLTYAVSATGPITITQAVPAESGGGTLTKVAVTDAAGTGASEVLFTSCARTAEVEVGAGVSWACTPAYNRHSGGASGGTQLTPAEQAFLAFVTDGKLTFGADGRLKIATSVDATGTFNHDGYASNYTKEVDGVKYTVTVSAAEITMRRAGDATPIMQLNKDGLVLGGARVLTEAEAAIALEEDGSARQTVLVHHGVYSLTVPAAASSFNLSALSLAEPSALGETIAHLWVTLESGDTSLVDQTWPTLDWVAENNRSAPPTLERGKTYLVALLRRGNYTGAHIALKPA